MKVKNSFLGLNLNSKVIHWDWKLPSALTGKSQVDCLPFIATAPYVDQLFGVAELTITTGQEVSAAVYYTICDWTIAFKVEAFFIRPF